MTPLEFPARINVEVTNRCNQACRLCPRGDLTRPLGLMPDHVFERVVDEVAAHDTVLWLHFLGEPLLHPRLVPLIERATAAGVRSVGLSTNATLLRGDLAEALATSGLDRLDISLDADDRASYLAMRGADDYERAVANTTAFLALRDRVDGPTPAVGLQYMDLPGHAASIERAVERWTPLLGERDFVKTIEPATFHGAVDEGTAPTTVGNRPPCPWLFGSLMILQDGTVTMCGADWDAAAPLGNVLDGTIDEIWNGTEMAARRRAHLTGRFSDAPLCGDCTDWHLADGHGYRNALPERVDRPGPVAVMLRDTTT